MLTFQLHLFPDLKFSGLWFIYRFIDHITKCITLAKSFQRRKRLPTDNYARRFTQPLGKFWKVFWSLPLQLKVWGGPGGSGGSEKHIWKIFYRGDPEIGTPGTPRGSHGTKFFLKKNFS